MPKLNHIDDTIQYYTANILKHIILIGDNTNKEKNPSMRKTLWYTLEMGVLIG